MNPTEPLFSLRAGNAMTSTRLERKDREASVVVMGPPLLGDAIDADPADPVRFPA